MSLLILSVFLELVLYVCLLHRVFEKRGLILERFVTVKELMNSLTILSFHFSRLGVARRHQLVAAIVQPGRASPSPGIGF
jgi:hypothetical protein